jgi:arsenite methyltransferase
VVWSRLIDTLHLTGHESILDLGCGRGAVVLIAADRLTTGEAVGVDLWRKSDQSGNGIDVKLVTDDMTDLPFPEATYDVVVSSLAMHNVKGAARRDRAIDETVRVLRPGGRLLIADIAASASISGDWQRWA